MFGICTLRKNAIFEGNFESIFSVHVFEPLTPDIMHQYRIVSTEMETPKMLLSCLVAYISTRHNIIGWGNQAVEIRDADRIHLCGVFRHKKVQDWKFLCEMDNVVCYYISQREFKPYYS